MYLFITKLAVSIAVAFSLLFVSERNPRVGGLLVGLPLGTGIIVAFYAIEQDVNFVISAVPYAIAGLGASLMFAIAYYLGSIFLPIRTNNFYYTFSNALCGLVGFCITGELIAQIKFDLLRGILVFLLIFALARIVFKKVKVVTVKPKQSSINKIIFRIIAVTIIILTITSIAGLIRSEWSGILASFPVMLSPLVIILTYDYHDKIFPTVLRNFSLSIISLALFYISLYFLLPVLSFVVAIVVTYTVCFIYVYLLNHFTNVSQSKYL